MLKFKPDRLGHGICIHPKYGGTEETWSTLCELKIPVGKLLAKFIALHFHLIILFNRAGGRIWGRPLPGSGISRVNKKKTYFYESLGLFLKKRSPEKILKNQY